MKMLKKRSFLILVIMLVNVVTTFAQDENLGPPPPPQEVVPINDLIIPFLFVAIFLGAYFFYVSNKKNLTVK